VLPSQPPPRGRAREMLALGVAPIVGEHVDRKGQVHEGGFADALSALANSSAVETMLELGTWYGGGSTLKLASTFARANARDSGARLLVTMESNKEAHEYARRTLAGMPVRLILGTSVAWTDIPTADEVERSGGVTGNANEKPLRDEWQSWYDSEVATMKLYNSPQLRPLCERFDFDAVLIDAGEFMGFAEWRIVRDVCRPRFVAMHDTNTYKCRAALAEALADPAYEVVARGDPPEISTGWAVLRSVRA
jgi:hypothetical protein